MRGADAWSMRWRRANLDTNKQARKAKAKQRIENTRRETPVPVKQHEYTTQ